MKRLERRTRVTVARALRKTEPQVRQAMTRPRAWAREPASGREGRRRRVSGQQPPQDDVTPPAGRR